MGFLDMFFGGSDAGNKIPPLQELKKPESAKKSPEVKFNFKELAKGEFKEVVFPDRFYGHPEQLPEQYKEINCTVSGFGELSGYSDYGGEGSKYDDENQDVMGVVSSSDGKKLLISVIDGAGGEGSGRQAAMAGVRGLSSPKDVSAMSLPELMQLANESIRRNGHGGKAAGVSALIEKDGFVTLVGIGDSKAVTVRKGQILDEGKTKMQNLAAMIHGENTSGYFLAKNNNIITNALGGREILNSVDPVTFQGEEGDVIVLASDALWDVMSEYEVQQIVKSSRDGDVLKIRQNIFDEVYRRNNSVKPFQIDCGDGNKVNMVPREDNGDNITVQVVEIKGLKPLKNKQSEMPEMKNSVPTVDRTPLLCSSGDLLWLKKIMATPNRRIPVRRSNGVWDSGKIEEINGKEMTAKVSFGEGRTHYKAVPLEVVLGWLKETRNDTKERDLMPLSTEKSLNDLRNQTLEAIRSSGLVAFFQAKQKSKAEIRLRTPISKGLSEWKDCVVTGVDVDKCEISYKTKDNQNSGKIPMALAFSYVKETEWRP